MVKVLAALAAIALLCFSLWRILAVPEALPPAGKPERIVSTALVTDEIAAGLVDPGRIVGMSRYAADENASNVAAVARAVNRTIDRDFEQILALNPDIVLSTRYSNVDPGGMLRHAAIPYHELTQFGTVDAIEANIRSMALALGEFRRGEELIAAMREKLQQAGRELDAGRRAWRAMYLAPGEWTAGTETTFDAILRHAGLRNAAAEAGVNGNVRIDIEAIIAIDPDVIVIGTGYARDSDYGMQLAADARLAAVAAVRGNRIVAIPSRHILTTSQFIGDAALELSRRVQALPQGQE